MYLVIECYRRGGPYGQTSRYLTHNAIVTMDELQEYAALCREVFGIELPQTIVRPVTITCWAHQFACFLVRREELGLQNQFRTLTLKLLDYGRRTAEEECKYTFDVTKGD